MMTTTISAANARKEFADILNKVAYGSETIVLTRRGKEVAALISMEDLALLQRLEDYIDIEDAKKALAEPGENIPAREFWEQLGL
jgi:prevent-host-death family protein